MPSETLFRWICLVALVMNLSISGYYRRKARQEGEAIPRQAEDGRLIALRLLVTLPLLLTIIVYVIHPAWLRWAQLNLPHWIRWVGAAMMVGAAPLVIWVMRNIGRNISETVLTKSEHELVTSGPYRWIRHPLYTAGLAMLIGLAFLTASAIIAALVVIVALLVVAVIIPREEAALINTFGSTYESYKRRTGRLLPAVLRNKLL